MQRAQVAAGSVTIGIPRCHLSRHQKSGAGIMECRPCAEVTASHAEACGEDWQVKRTLSGPRRELWKEVLSAWANRSCHHPWEVAGAIAEDIRDGLASQVSRMGCGPRVVEAAVRIAWVSVQRWLGEESAKDTTVWAWER